MLTRSAVVRAMERDQARIELECPDDLIADDVDLIASGIHITEVH